MSKKIACLKCNRKKVIVKIDEEVGYIEVLYGVPKVNNFTDGTVTVDFYCDECSEAV
jgi:hypothetical protein